MKIIDVVTPAKNLSAVESIIGQHDSEVLWVSADEDRKKVIRALVSDDQRQSLLDALQGLFQGEDHSKILVTALEASLPRKEPTLNEKDSFGQVPAPLAKNFTTRLKKIRDSIPLTYYWLFYRRWWWQSVCWRITSQW